MIYLYVIVGMCSSFLLSLALLLFYLRYKRNILQQQFQIQVNELEYQKKLTQVIITSQEQERKRIGKELHDDVGNSLVALRLYLDKYMYLPDGSNTDIREEYNKRIGSIFNKLRTISHQLSVSEIELFGLKEAVFMLCDYIEQSGKFVIHIDDSQCEIPEHLEYNTSVMIYRVFQELLTNTIKHADANEVTISFEHQAALGNLIISYCDNGKGLDSDVAHQGFGFKNIESRLQAVNGYYEINNTAASGFSIKIFIPLNQLVSVPATSEKSLQS
jgi:signal transduction histidine kinase